MGVKNEFDYRIDYGKYTPMGTWLFGGETSSRREEIIKHLIENDDWYAYYYNDRVIAPISEFYLPSNILDFAIVEEYNYLYFSIKDQPNKLYAQVIPDVRNTEMFVQDTKVVEGMHHDGFNLKVLPFHRFEEDIISTQSTSQNLYVITANRSRHKTDENFSIHKLSIHAQIGFQSTGHIKLKLNLPHNWQNYKIKNSNLPISVSIVEEKPYDSIVYVSGPCRPYLCRGHISPNSSTLDLSEIQFDEKLVKKERLPLTLIHQDRHKSFYSSEDSVHDFYLTGIDSNSIYSISIVNEKGSIKKHFETQNHEVHYFSTFTTTLSNQPGLEQENFKNNTQMLLGFDHKLRRLIAVFKVGDEMKILPIIGGGNVSLFSATIHKNMLDYELPEINRAILIPDVCILAGNAETMNWFTIQLPRRLYALSYYEKNPEIKMNPENYMS